MVVRNGRTRKIDGVLEAVGHHFNDIRVGHLVGIFDPLFQRSHRNSRFFEQRQNGGVDRAGIDERLIALNVDNEVDIFESGGHFGNAVGAGNMVCAGHFDTGAESARARRKYARRRSR